MSIAPVSSPACANLRWITTATGGCLFITGSCRRRSAPPLRASSGRPSRRPRRSGWAKQPVSTPRRRNRSLRPTTPRSAGKPRTLSGKQQPPGWNPCTAGWKNGGRCRRSEVQHETRDQQPPLHRAAISTRKLSAGRRAALLGHLKASGCDDFRFLDLRLLAPDIHSPTYNPVGVFGESFIIDVPDLPLVLRVLKGSDDGRRDSVGGPRDACIRSVQLRARVDPARLHAYLVEMDQFLEDVFAPLGDLRFVGFSVWSSNLTTTLMAAARLKRRRRSLCVIVGGPQVTESRAAALLGLRAGLFDAVVLGEGEQGSPERLPRVRSGTTGGRPAGGPRLGPGGAGGPSAGPPAAAPFQPSGAGLYGDVPARLPRPGRKAAAAVPVLARLHRQMHLLQRMGLLGAVPTRRRRSLSGAAAGTELRDGINRFHFTDSLINGHMKRLRHFAQAVIDRELAVDWGGFMRRTWMTTRPVC